MDAIKVMGADPRFRDLVNKSLADAKVSAITDEEYSERLTFAEQLMRGSVEAWNEVKQLLICLSSPVYHGSQSCVLSCPW